MTCGIKLSDDLSGVSSDELLALFRASQEWYRLLGEDGKDGGGEERPAATGVVDITERTKSEGRWMAPARNQPPTVLQPVGAVTSVSGSSGTLNALQGTRRRCSSWLALLEARRRVGDWGREGVAILSTGDDGRR
jgi:hypothetical protein